MRIISIVVIIIACLSSARAQSVKYGNNETSTYSDSQKSSDFTYLMWDRNDDGDGNFSNNITPKFFYWDNDDAKLNYLLDTGNMSQLDASFNEVGIGTLSPEEKLHVKKGNFKLEMDSRYSDNPFYTISNHNGADIYNEYYRWTGGGSNYYGWRFLATSSSNGGFLFEFGGSKNLGEHSWDSYLAVNVNGNIGIGTKSPSEKLTVNGTAKAEEIIVEEDIGADFVFEDDYDLPTLKEVESHIQKQNHLQGIPSADEMKKNGVKVGDLQMKLLQKIEELTLHTITQQKVLKELRESDEKQKMLIERLQNEVKNLKSEKSQYE